MTLSKTEMEAWIKGKIGHTFRKCPEYGYSCTCESEGKECFAKEVNERESS